MWGEEWEMGAWKVMKRTDFIWGHATYVRQNEYILFYLQIPQSQDIANIHYKLPT